MCIRDRPNTGPCTAPAQSWARFVPGPKEATMVLDVGAGLTPEEGLKAAQCSAFATAGGWPE